MTRNDRIQRTLVTLVIAMTSAATLLVSPVGAEPLLDNVLDPIGDMPTARCEFANIPTGELQDTWDYGDAPDSWVDPSAPYPTYYTSGGNPQGRFPTRTMTQNAFGGQPGARHHILNVGWLANLTAYELFEPLGLATGDGPPSPEAEADLGFDPDGLTNLDPNTATPDHDAHDNGLFPGTLPAGGTGAIRFRVSSYPGITRWYVNILLDWNFDGRWSGATGGPPEWAVANFPVTVGAMRSIIFSAPVTVGNMPGEPWTRITLTPQPIVGGPFGAGWDGSVPTGTFDFLGRRAFPCGETEDYCGRIVVTPALQPPAPSGVRCPRPGTPPPTDPCDGVFSYTVDISTGTTNGAQNAWYDLDPDWFVTLAGNNPPASPDVYSLKPQSGWHTPATGTWINPYGNQFYDSWNENNWNNAPAGDYVYELLIPTSPTADGVYFDFKWWRDDSTLDPTKPFEFFDEDTNTWISMGTGYGWSTSAATQSGWLDFPANPSGSYHLRVTVENSGAQWTGLLVEGTATVFCDGVPF